MKEKAKNECNWCGREATAVWVTSCTWPHGLRTSLEEDLCEKCPPRIQSEMRRRGAAVTMEKKCQLPKS